MADERRPSPPSRGPRNRPAGGRAPSAPLTGPLVVDAATSDALRLFNARLGAQAENEKAERRVQKAAKAKDDAAARVRALENDTKATAEQRTEAAAAYRSAVEAWERAKKGEAEPAPARAGTSDADDTPTEDAAADETPADDTPTDEAADQSTEVAAEGTEDAAAEVAATEVAPDGAPAAADEPTPETPADDAVEEPAIEEPAVEEPAAEPA